MTTQGTRDGSSRRRAAVTGDFRLKRDTYYRDNYGEGSRNFSRQLRRELISRRLAAVKDGSLVLDLGCGPALLFPSLQKRCGRYVAVDLVASNLTKAAEGAQGNVSFVQADLDRLPFAGPAADAIVCAGAIEYASDPREGLRQMAAMLRPGGLLVCSFPNGRSPWRLWSDRVYGPLSARLKKTEGSGAGSYGRALFAAPDVMDQLARHGLEKIECVPFGIRTLPRPLDRVSALWDSRLNRACRRGAPPWAAPFCSEFLVTARRPA